MSAIAPAGVSVHFTRLSTTGVPGDIRGQEERNREQIADLPRCAATLALVRPAVIALAHTTVSYTLGRQAESELVSRIEGQHHCRFITAFASAVAALESLKVKRIALGTPYEMSLTERGRALLEEHGFTVVSHLSLPGVTNIYNLTPDSAYRLGRMVDRDDAEAVFISGTGMPTLAAIEALESDLGKPVISAASATMWNALRLAGIRAAIPGLGRLLAP
jgi:maleate cis-trans isomerase